MIKIRFVLVSLILLFSLAFADEMASKEKTCSDYEAVKKAIEQSIGWAIEKDFDAMFRLWADNMFHFWLFSDSQVVGLDNFLRFMPNGGRILISGAPASNSRTYASCFLAPETWPGIPAFSMIVDPTRARSLA